MAQNQRLQFGLIWVQIGKRCREALDELPSGALGGADVKQFDAA